MIRTNIEQMMAGHRFQIEEREAQAPDSRLAELLDWQRETGNELPMPADLILWLEDHGYVVDLLTGCTERLEPLQTLIDEATAEEAADTEDYEWDIDDRNIWRRGGW